MTEREKALANIPEGYEVVKNGFVKDKHKQWNGKEFVSGKDFKDMPVTNFTCVIRPIETKQSFEEAFTRTF